MIKISEWILWGSAGHAKVLSEIISFNGGNVIAIFDNNKTTSSLSGVSFYGGKKGFSNWRREQDQNIKNVAGAIAIGGNKGKDRLLILSIFRKSGISIPLVAHPSAVISSSASVGIGSQILALSNVAAEVQLGDACIVNHRASIDHECVIGDGVHIGPGATICGCVNIEENVFIGAGAIVLPRISIAANSIVGAGAVVNKDVLKEGTVIGNPARLMKKNNNLK